VDRREDIAELGVVRLHLNPDADAAELAHDLRGGRDGHRRTSVTPNHVLRGAPEWTGGPHGAPAPAAALPAPHEGHAGARRVVVGVLDTGIDPHPWFHGKKWYEACTPQEHEDLSGDKDWDLDSEAGHGTFVAGVILQRAPHAYLRVERVLSPDGVTDELRVLHGLNRISARAAQDADRVDVLNLSLGCFTFDDKPSPVLAEAVAALSRTTVVVAAAGNDGTDRPYWPAALKDVVAVGALAAQDGPEGPDRASFSNYGWWVDAAAPGEDVKSAFLTHGTENGESFHGYASWSGTSFAAPYVAGSIAALMSAKDMSARDALGELLDPAAGTRLPDLGQLLGGNEG
jgi:subtilisin family serine protease